MFYSSNICIINKIDLLPYLKFDVEKLKENTKKVNPNIQFLKFQLLQEKEWKLGMNFKSKIVKS